MVDLEQNPEGKKPVTTGKFGRVTEMSSPNLIAMDVTLSANSVLAWWLKTEV